MPPKGHSRRSTRGAKPSGAPDSSNSTGHNNTHSSTAFKDEEPVKPRRGAATKARTASYQLEDVKPTGRGSKLGACFCFLNHLSSLSDWSGIPIIHQLTPHLLPKTLRKKMKTMKAVRPDVSATKQVSLLQLCAMFYDRQLTPASVIVTGSVNRSRNKRYGIHGSVRGMRGLATWHMHGHRARRGLSREILLRALSTRPPPHVRVSPSFLLCASSLHFT